MFYLKNNPTAPIKASVLGWTECRAIANTAEEAIERVRTLLNDRISKSKIIQIQSSPSTPHYHPWMKFAARLKDNPFLDEIDQSIAESRLALADQQALQRPHSNSHYSSPNPPKPPSLAHYPVRYLTLPTMPKHPKPNYSPTCSCRRSAISSSDSDRPRIKLVTHFCACTIARA